MPGNTITMTGQMLEGSGSETGGEADFVLYWASEVLTAGDSILLIGFGDDSLSNRLEASLKVSVLQVDQVARTQSRVHADTRRDADPEGRATKPGCALAVDAIWLPGGSLPLLKSLLASIAKSRPVIGCCWSESEDEVETVTYALKLGYEAQVMRYGHDHTARDYLVLIPGERTKRYELRASGMMSMERIARRAFIPGAPLGQGSGVSASGQGTKGPLLAISFYRTPKLVEFIRKGIVRISPELRALNCEVVLYNDSPDDGSVCEALKAAHGELSEQVTCVVETNPRNLGFIKTMNSAMSRARREGRDILLMNSDAMLSPGSLEEMIAVAAMDPMIGFVCPRSNNATIATAGTAQSVALDNSKEQRRLERSTCASLRFLPRYQFVPTAVGYCLLIRHSMLVNFGEFSVDYGLGYNEENDFIMRAGRCGFRAALANWAFALHLGEQSFALHTEGRNAREKRNRKLLDERYPEYGSLITSYFNSPSYKMESFLDTLREPRPAIAIDCTALLPAHNGTIALVASLVKEIAAAFGAIMDITLVGSGKAFRYHGLNSLENIIFSEGWPNARYDVAIKIGQPFSEGCVSEMSRMSPVNVFFMLDTIAVDCSQLYTAKLELLWRYVASSADGLIFNSAFTRDQFNRRFAVDLERTVQRVSYHSVDPADYRRTGATSVGGSSHVLIVGNHYPHKNVWPTYHALVAGAPDYTYIVLGGGGGKIVPSRQDVYYESGSLSSELVASLYSNSALVVFPSFYEGFGFPIQNSLAHERPIFVRDNDLNRELLNLIQSPNMYLYGSTAELLDSIAQIPTWISHPAGKNAHNWKDSAREIIELCLECLNRTQQQTVIRRQHNLRNLLLDLHAQDHGGGLRRALHEVRMKIGGKAHLRSLAPLN